MSKRSILAGIVLFAFSAIVLAQLPAGPPQPGPEEKRLGYYAGKWHSERCESPLIPIEFQARVDPRNDQKV